jgi:hypothetical protein
MLPEALMNLGWWKLSGGLLVAQSQRSFRIGKQNILHHWWFAHFTEPWLINPFCRLDANLLY